MAEKEDNVLTEDDNTSRNGEENFKEEIKDYAKTTMNELLGMFGYDEEITSESVDSLDIKVPSAGDETKATTSTTASSKVVVITTAGMLPASATMTSVSMTTTPPVILPVSEESSSDTPIIIKVEGNTSVSDIIRQQNDVAATTVSPSVSKTPDPPATEPNKVTQPATQAQSTVTTVSQSTAVQPALEKQPITTQRSSSSSNSKSVQSTTKSTMSTAPVVKKLSPYLQYSYQLNQNDRPCTWCKKNTQLKNFTFREGVRVLECRGICSEECFEKAALSIDVNNENIKGIQERIRQLRDSKRKKFSWPLFDWERYLKMTGSKGAPGSFFKQSTTPPHNGFKPGMKLEVSDPRIIKCTCLATVVATLGPRIRCRFDGTDKSNDVWHIVDSTEIHPVGWCVANEGILQPPIGFRKDVGQYQMFITKTLASDSPDSIIAPARIFKKEPDGPEKSKFYPGLKLEAMDPKNPALICVATVGKIEGEKIRVDFDGYLGSDYWCRFDSRSIFPVGWCALSGHPLQPPGNSKKLSKLQSATRTKNSKEPEEATQRSSRTHTTLSASSSHHITSPAQDSTTISTSSSHLEVPHFHLNRLSFPTVCVYVNHGCKIGQFLDPKKLSRLPSYWRGRISDVLKPCLQGIVDCAYEQPTVFGFLRPGTGKTRIVARGNGQKLSCMLQTIDRVRIFWKVLDRFLEDLRCCENFMSSTQINGGCNKCQRTSDPKGRAKRSSTEAASEAPSSKALKLCVRQEIDESPPQVCSTSPAKTWTVDEVIKYMENTELADYISLFKIHEIDGRALLLLNRDMIMSYMGLKLGPAIKLLNIVQELKPKQTCEA